MRWLVRFLIFWAIGAPLFYFFGLPALLDLLTQQARTEGYERCYAHMQKEGLTGKPGSPISEQHATTYCHCVNDNLTVVREDLFDMIQKVTPKSLTVTAHTQVDKCNRELQNVLAGKPANTDPELITF